MYIDNFHLPNHKDPACKTTLNIKLTGFKMNTEICERTFRWLAAYKHITRHMNEARFLLFMLYVCHMHNVECQRVIIDKLKRKRSIM